jgi:hypothetical protein
LKDGDVRPVLAEREKETMDVMAWLLSVLWCIENRIRNILV